MSTKNRKIFKIRHIITGVLILFLLIILGLNYILPIGEGEHNKKQLEKFQTDSPSNQFSFAVMGDNKNSFKTFKDILTDVDNNNFLFAIDVGDLVLEGSKGYYRAFNNQIKNVKTPFLTAVGNHDIRDHGKENYTAIYGDFYYSFDYGTDYNATTLNEEEAAAVTTGLLGLSVVGIIIAVIALLVGLFFFIFWIFMLVDCVKRDFENRGIWLAALIITFFIGWSWLATILYYFLVKRKNLGSIGGGDKPSSSEPSEESKPAETPKPPVAPQ